MIKTQQHNESSKIKKEVCEMVNQKRKAKNEIKNGKKHF